MLAREQPDSDLFHPWGLSTEEAIDIARRCEAAAFSVSRKIRTRKVRPSRSQSQFVFANSLGFVGGYPGSRQLDLVLGDRRGQGLMQRDDWFSAARVPPSSPSRGRWGATPTSARCAPGRAQDCDLPGAGAVECLIHSSA